ncbi:MAG: arylesterase [Luteitalea sp.]|nr:arylesterase [Luteitalea sp.]
MLADHLDPLGTCTRVSTSSKLGHNVRETMRISSRQTPRTLLTAAALLLVLTACTRGRSDPTNTDSALTSEPATSDARDTAPPQDGRPRIVVLGDSIAAGLGLGAHEAFPAVVQQQLDEAGYDFEVVAAGVSGDTSAGGLRRLDWVLEGDVRVLVLELGGNDGLRGLTVAQMKQNLGAIIERAQARDIDVLLCGMEAPPNFGVSYTAEFRRAFQDLARTPGVRLLPFVLEDVAGVPALNQADGIHPNAEGARRVAGNVWKVLEPLLAKSPPS